MDEAVAHNFLCCRLALSYCPWDCLTKAQRGYVAETGDYRIIRSKQELRQVSSREKSGTSRGLGSQQAKGSQAVVVGNK